MSRWSHLFSMVLSMLLLSSVSHADAAVTVRSGSCDFGDTALPSLILENAFFSLTLVPDRAGRIVEWIDKRQGHVNVVSLPRDSEQPNYGGMLDDHGWASEAVGLASFYNHPYAYKFISNGAREVVLEMWPEGHNHFRRTLTLRDNSPLLEVAYVFENTFQEDGNNILIRNVVWPSGGPNPDDHLYSTPLTSGVRVDRNYLNTAHAFNTESVAAPWRAFGSVKQKRLVAFAFGNDLFAGAYDWEGSIARPSFEWYYHPIPAGKRMKTMVWIYLSHGFSKAVHVSERMVADLDLFRRDKEVEIDWAFAAMDATLKEVTIQTVVLDIAGQELARLPEIVLVDLEVDTRREGRISWRNAASRPVIIRQTVMSGGHDIACYEQPFELAGTAYTRPTERPAQAAQEAIEGWTPPTLLEVKPDDEDRKRGYVVYAGDGPNRGESLRQIELYLGGGEYESKELRFKALTELGTNVTLSVALPSGLPPHALTVTSADKIFVGNFWGKDKSGWRLSRLNRLTPSLAADARFWLIANSTGLKPGRYPLELEIVPQQGAATTLSVILTVSPVRLPDDRHYFLEANSHFNHLGLDETIHGGQRWKWNIPTAEVYADDFHAHGGRMVTAYAHGTAPGGTPAAIRLRNSGEWLEDALKADASWLNREAPLPALDLSFWDPWLQIWFERGFTRYTSGYLWGDVPGYWNLHRDLAIRFGADDPQRIRRWILSETARYLKEKGYRYVYGLIGDEIGPDIFDEWLSAAKDASECGWSPGVTIANSFFLNPTIYPQAASFMDYWVISEPEADLIRQARADGLITPGNSLGSYDGYGTRFREYAPMRAAMWKYVLAGMDVFWVQCYIRNDNESIVFHEQGIPYSSAAWEGVRDGCEDGNYLKGALGMIGLLQVSSPQAAAIFSNRLDRIVAAIDTEDAESIRQAKTGLLQLMLELYQVLPEVKPSLLWEDLPIISDGEPRFTLASSAEAATAARQFAAAVLRKSGIALPVKVTSDPAAVIGDTILFGHPDDSSLLRQLAGTAEALDVTPSYPSTESYTIVERTRDGRRIIVVIGKRAGLLRGADNFSKLLKLNPEFPCQYFTVP